MRRVENEVVRREIKSEREREREIKAGTDRQSDRKKKEGGGGGGGG